MTFDETYDVVVVGYGFAGGAAAIEAADQGASVLLIEKMPDPGGISICAGGGVRLAKDADDAFAYLNATNAGRTDEDVLRTFADEVTNLEGYLRDLASINDAKVVVRDRPGNYPFPGLDTWGFFEVAEIPGFDPLEEYPHVRGRLGGPLVFKVVDDNVRKRAIDVRMNCPAVRLIKGDDGGLTGLTVEQDGE
ncbi:MAG: FAD-binding protein, partial [Rhodospirillales bacterium]|nr:FAD-binding protein [Rhodospirillales bacterium]